MLYIWKTQYILIEERLYTPELGVYRSFGIMAVRRVPHRRQCGAYVRDISTNRAFTAKLAKRCNREGLSLIHFRDFITDALGC